MIVEQLFDGACGEVSREALAQARGAWTNCNSRGFDLTYWQADEQGRWRRRD